MRDAAHVPELGEDTAAGIMNRSRDATPAEALFFRIDAGGVPIDLSDGRDLGAFGHDQPGPSTLTIVRNHPLVRYAARRPITRHRRHDQAVGQHEAAELERLE